MPRPLEPQSADVAYRSRLPQWMQKRLPMRLFLPHSARTGRGSVSGSAHLTQYGVRTLLSVLHFGQATSLVTRCLSRSALISLAEK